MRKLLTFLFKTDPKELILHSKDDIRKHAETLSQLSPEEKARLADYLTRAEMNRCRSEKNSKYGYGVSVRYALEIQKHRSH